MVLTYVRYHLKVFDGMYKHILTDKGLELFDADWATVCDESKTVH